MKTLRFLILLIFALGSPAVRAANVTWASITASGSPAGTDYLVGYRPPMAAGAERRFLLSDLQTYFTTGYLLSATAATTYQPLDSDLTAIAALTTTSFGRGLLAETSATTLKTTLGLTIGTNVQAYAANLDSWAAIAPSAKLDASNVSTNTALGTSNSLVPSQNAVKIYVDGAISGSVAGVASLNSLTGAVTLSTPHGFNINNGSTVIPVGTSALFVMGKAGTITGGYISSDTSGSIVISTTKNGTSIVASAPPTSTTGTTSQAVALTGWTTTYVAGDVFVYSVTSCTGVHSVSLTLNCTE